jgi:hypothetical protein
MNAMWRLTMFLLCLIAALSGTPLRQAEAADDFARSIGEPGHADVIETIDGGVGDDIEVAVLTAGSDTHLVSASFLLATADVHFTPLITASSRINIDVGRPPDLSTSLAIGSDRWFAWIQCFLF